MGDGWMGWLGEWSDGWSGCVGERERYWVGLPTTYLPTYCSSSR